MKYVSTVQSFIDDLQERGWYIFTKDEISQKVLLSQSALYVALYRQEQKGRILKIKNGFYVIVPLEYKAIGSIPVEWFLGSLMKFLNLPYYIALLSAAAYHGATHQAVQITQVMTTRKIPDIRAGRLHIEFIQKKEMLNAEVQPIKTPMGSVIFGSPEQTAFDIVQYIPKCGHLDHVATILSELSEKISAKKLKALLPYQEKTTLQRLGYLLETLEKEDLAVPLKKYVNPLNLPYIGLRADRPKHNYPIAKDWHLYINHTVEIDEL
jgi:predicted transcriptional regulator of viral defense system